MQNQKPTSEEILLIAEQLHMEKEVIWVWFGNRRKKERRINLGGAPHKGPYSPHTVRPTAPHRWASQRPIAAIKGPYSAP